MPKARLMDLTESSALKSSHSMLGRPFAYISDPLLIQRAVRPFLALHGSFFFLILLHVIVHFTCIFSYLVYFRRCFVMQCWLPDFNFVFIVFPFFDHISFQGPGKVCSLCAYLLLSLTIPLRSRSSAVKFYPVFTAP